jgi:hypothetical protein
VGDGSTYVRTGLRKNDSQYVTKYVPIVTDLLFKLL